ncbi:MAG: Rne/Rng family ribonuclease [Clostridiales bacterium]|jgi:ribonuclease G|nr:Rne/Rng family ribonuclease [Clostridiales bacterium]
MKQLIIDNGEKFIRLARIADNTVTEISVWRKDSESRVGNIYAAKVKNILPARFVFLDIGAQKDAFFNLNDAKEKYLQDGGEGKLKISAGCDILVQVVKDETENKGACVTTQLNFTNKYFVLIANSSSRTVGVSQKITSDGEKERLKAIAISLLPEGYAAIIRTEAENCGEDELTDALKKLIENAKVITEQGLCRKAPSLLYGEESLLAKAADKMLTKDTEEIIISGMENSLREYLRSVYGDMTSKLTLYSAEAEENIFDKYGVQGQIEKALNKKVWLKSGGYLYIEQTEACVVIDVNSGKFISGKSHGKTVNKTNFEAADEIARQIRLRNLSGMIMIDFINCEDKQELKRLEEHLKAAVKSDRMPVSVACVTEMGVFLLTRKKTYEPIESFLTQICPCCQGTGRIRI